jgi:ribonucleoside-diphosphate reductase alpha chain
MFGEKQVEFLSKKQYIRTGESLECRINSITELVRTYEDQYYDGLADRIHKIISGQILSPSTPQWANLGRNESIGTTPLPVSCYILSVPNSIQGIYYSLGETAMMSKLGGGVGIDYTNVIDKGTFLSEGFYSNSKLDWAEDIIRTGQKVSQQSQRRGYAVPFFSIEDPEFYEMLARADKKNSDKTDPFIDNNIGFILPVGFRDKVSNGDKEAQKRYLKVLTTRVSSGKIYLLDIENCNKNQSPVYEILGHEVSSTNICTEALTPKYDDMSFTCVLSSLNLVHWDKIKEDPQIIKDCFAFLDINASEFIRLTDGVQFMEKARRSAINKRDIGLGTLGFHEYLQNKDMAYGDIQSRAINKEIYSTIRKYGEEFTQEIGEKLGSPKMCEDAGLTRRNVSLMMVAPNKSTAFICGNTSSGIEPFMSNYFVKALAGIQATFRNPYLEKLLNSYNKNSADVWESILKNLGSVQHLDFLNNDEKNVFKTASEISPKDMIDLAADRQKYIDMSQSLNLFNRPNYSINDVYNIHKYAFDNGIKTLYYYYPQAHASLEKNGDSWDSCVSCAD